MRQCNRTDISGATKSIFARDDTRRKQKRRNFREHFAKMERYEMRHVSIFIASAVATLLSAPASAAPFERLWVFGDSTVDTGWYNFQPSGESQFDRYLSSYNLARPRNIPPTYGMGKPTSSPGPVSVEVLAALIGTEALPADAPLTVSADPGLRELI